jgi:DNA-binding NarL/FixJ family response regulator
VSRSSRHSPRRTHEGEQLTRREQEVFALVANGEPTSAISQRLGISENTIKSHLTETGLGPKTTADTPDTSGSVKRQAAS